MFRPLVWTADGRPHPAATRTLRFAAECAVTRNSQQATANALVSRWKHEIQIAILRRRAAMSRAVLPRASAREEFLLTGQVDHERGSASRAPPVDEDESDDDDDNDDDDEGGGSGESHERSQGDAMEDL